MIPKAAIKKILKENGCERVSEDAVDTLHEVVTEYASVIAADAAQYANHAGRKTVKAKDISLAA